MTSQTRLRLNAANEAPTLIERADAGPAPTKTNCPGADTAPTNDERPDESTPEEIGR
jgi:hypothetical protein